MVRSRWGINLVATLKTYGNKLKSRARVIFIAILLVMMKPGRFSGHAPSGEILHLVWASQEAFFLANSFANGSLQDEMV